MIPFAAEEFRAIRTASASLPADVSNDAIGAFRPKLSEMYAPEAHAAALDPTAPIVLGARGTGKSFWAGVLGDDELRRAAAKAYPRSSLAHLDVQFGYTGIEGPQGIGGEKLDSCIPRDAGIEEAPVFFWATILRAEIRGKILVTVAVRSSGSVASARIAQSSLKSPEVLDCITGRLQQLRLPPPGEDVEITLPLSLVPSEP